MTESIRAEGLKKSYGDAPAVGPVDLVVRSGERVTLVGHNGSGKTTFMKMVAGLLEPSEGSVTVEGHPAGSIEARQALSYLGDQPVFYDDLTVDEHLEYVAKLHGNDEWQDDAELLLDTLGIAHRAADVPTTFSRGLKQKAAIALAFIRPFELMVIDEPFVGLDQEGRAALIKLVDDAHDLGATLVVATHELTMVQASHRVIALRDGDVIHDGRADEAALSALLTR